MKLLTPPKSIVFDVDGVLLDWLNPFLRWVQATKGIETAIHPSEQTNYSLTTLFPDADMWEIGKWVIDFNKTDRFASLPAVDGAITAMTQIRDAFPDWDLVAVTCPGNHPRIVAGRAHNISTLFPEIQSLTIMDYGASKRSALSLHPLGSLLIDDHPRYLDEAVCAGMTAVSFDHPYNRSIKRFPRILNWATGVDTLLRLSPMSNQYDYEAA